MKRGFEETLTHDFLGKSANLGIFYPLLDT